MTHIRVTLLRSAVMRLSGSRTTSTDRLTTEQSPSTLPAQKAGSEAHYTSESVYQLLSELHRRNIMVIQFGKFVPNVLAKKNKQFAELNAVTH